MNLPVLTATGGIYQLVFSSEQIEVQVDRLNENSKYETSGEITVKSVIPGFAGFLHRARLNLTSSPTRKAMAKVLEDKMPGIAWAEILEAVCVMVLDNYREGTPMITLAAMPMPEGATYLLDPYLQQGQATLFFGEGEVGKSWFGIYMGVLVSAGMSQLNMAAEQGNVLYLDYETDEDTLWERVNLVTTGLEIALPEGFKYRQMHQLVAHDIQQIGRLVVDSDIKLVVIDSAAPAVGDPEQSNPTNEYFNALRSLRTTTLTIAHVSKGGKENEPFGSIFWRNLPRANFRVNGIHEPGSGHFTLGLKHTKANNSRRMRDLAYNIDISDGAAVFSLTDAIDVPGLAESLSHGERITNALKRGAKAITELEAELDLSYRAVHQTLTRGEGKQYVKVEDGGKTFWANQAAEHQAGF